MILGTVSLHINCFLYTRSGKLESLFSKVKNTPEHITKLRNTIKFWTICCSILAASAIIASVIYVGKYYNLLISLANCIQALEYGIRLVQINMEYAYFHNPFK